MTVLLGDATDANFTLTTSSYTSGNGECGYLVTAPSNGIVNELSIRISTSATASNWRLMVRSTSGAMLANATVAAGENVTRTVSVTPFAVTAGTQYRLTFVVNTGSPRPYQNAVQNTVAIDTSSTYASPETTFTVETTPSSLRQFQMWATGSLPSQTITTVNSGNPVKIGSTVTIAVNGFTKTITKGTLDGVVLTAASATSITLPSMVDEVTWPRAGTGRVLFVSSADDTETATVNIPVAAQDGFSYQAIAAGFNTGEADSIAYLFDPALAETDIIYFDPTKGTVSALAGYDGSYDGSQTLWHQQGSTKIGRSFTLITEDGGEIVVPAITSAGTIRIGGTTTIEVEGFDADVNAGTLDGKALAAASNTSITMSPLANGVETYRPGTRTLSLTDGAKAATTEREVFPPTGWSSYAITGDFVEAINGVAATYLPVGWAVTDFILYPLSPSSGKTTTVGDAGVVTGNVGTQELFLVDAATGMATAFDIVTTAGAGSVGVGGGGSESLTSRKLIGSKFR